MGKYQPSTPAEELDDVWQEVRIGTQVAKFMKDHEQVFKNRRFPGDIQKAIRGEAEKMIREYKQFQTGRPTATGLHQHAVKEGKGAEYPALAQYAMMVWKYQPSTPAEELDDVWQEVRIGTQVAKFMKDHEQVFKNRRFPGDIQKAIRGEAEKMIREYKQFQTGRPTATGMYQHAEKEGLLK